VKRINSANHSLNERLKMV